MPQPVSDERLIEILRAKKKHKTSAAAGKALGLSSSTVRNHLITARHRGLTAESPPQLPPDNIELRRLRERIRIESSGRAAAERHAAADKSIREAVFGLAADPLVPPSWNPAASSDDERLGEAVILNISDLHMGERIDLKQMGGMNSFDEKIARARLARLFQATVRLLSAYWSGRPPSIIYAMLMGDLVSGEIHEELAKTNDLLSIPAVRAVSECLIAGLELLLREFPQLIIEVVSVAGNHGRKTKKPEAKGFSIDSYDTLVAWVIESWFSAKKETRIRFSAPSSGDALINIFGWNFLVTHGDRIGSRGGSGFVGPAATISRGFQRVVMEYAAQGVVIDFIMIGHFHTSMELPQGFANGSLPGPSEYSRSGRMRPEPASQWLFTVHPRRGIARRWKIQVGDPSEGSIYRGRDARQN